MGSQEAPPTSCGEDGSPTTNTTEFFLARVSGSGQRALIGREPSAALVVLLTDKTGQPVPNRRIDFSVESGAATLLWESVLSDTLGFAETRVRLGMENTS